MDLARLDSPEARDSSRFGNKAANLAIAIREGFRVPRGIAISRDSPTDPPGLREHLVTLVAPYAVRSSSLVEDGADRAFPGIFDTILGACSVEEVLAAAARIRASATGPDLRHYAGPGTDDVAMGVLVQELVDASCAGVAFSRDPVTTAKNVVIESAYGLGKSVVEGEITPDSHDFAHSGELLTKQIGTKRTRIDFRGALTHIPVPADEAGKYALSDGQARQVFQMTMTAEVAFGYPIDIEWAFDRSGELWLLQARPITALASTDPRRQTND